MPEEDHFSGTPGEYYASNGRRTSTWEFLPEIGISPRNIYKFHENAIRDRQLFKTKGKFIKNRQKITEELPTEGTVELPLLKCVHLSLDIDIGNSEGEPGSQEVAQINNNNNNNNNGGQPARFNEPLNSYIATKKRLRGINKFGFKEDFPRSLPSLDQTTMSRKLASKLRQQQQQQHQQQQMCRGITSHFQYDLPPLSSSKDASAMTNVAKQVDNLPRTNHLVYRHANETGISENQSETALHIWDPTLMDTLMKSGKVLVPR